MLGLVCALDMYSTLWWVLTGRAVEANPLLAWTFDTHPLAFVLLKSAFCLPALLLAPGLARRRPALTIWLLRGTLAGYITLYLVGIHVLPTLR